MKFFSENHVVLGYINNIMKRFFVYVVNHVVRIRNNSKPSQGSYVRPEVISADVGT